MNEYLHEYQELVKATAGPPWAKELARYSKRRDFVLKYAFAIPDDEAIEKIAKFSPILELGAGAGYWAMLLRQAGAEVLAVDKRKPTHGMRRALWSPVGVTTSAAKKAAKHSRTHSLMFCWPSMDDWCEKALEAYTGQHVIYIGEGKGGCTGTDDFHDILDNLYEQIDYQWIPQWDGIHDQLTIYRRKGKG